MKIAELLREELVLSDLQAADKAGVLAELCAAVARVQPAATAGRLTETLLEREKLGSTGVGEGVAIPHGKLASMPSMICAFGRSRRGVEFQAIDGKPAQLFLVLFAPENSAGLHLKALARLSRLFRSPAFRKSILDAPDRAAIYKLIIEEDAKY